jgi:murein DD-endopeptidase MepM/ murein hydrolase activator NlpD
MISNPIKGYKNKKYPQGHVSQWLGENVAMYHAAIPALTKGHNGIDIVAPWGTPMYAVEDGIVCDVKTDPSGYGMHVRFLTGDSKDKKSIFHEWTYGHCSAIFVKIGDVIKAGQKIANMGNTGFVVSSANGAGFWVDGSNKYLGTHLHLGCREIKYPKSGGWRYNPETPKIQVENYFNGLAGSIDFKDMFYEDSMLGDMQILKQELEKHGDEPWYMTLIRSLKFFNN